MARCEAESEPLSYLNGIAGESLPVQVEFQIVWEVHAQIGFRGNAVESVLQLFFVYPNRNIRVYKFLQSAGVVDMQMPDNDAFNVLDCVASLLNGSFELMIWRIIDSRCDIY